MTFKIMVDEDQIGTITLTPTQLISAKDLKMTPIEFAELLTSFYYYGGFHLEEAE